MNRHVLEFPETRFVLETDNAVNLQHLRKEIESLWNEYVNKQRDLNYTWNAALDAALQKLDGLLEGQIMSSNIFTIKTAMALIEGLKVKDEDI